RSAPHPAGRRSSSRATSLPTPRACAAAARALRSRRAARRRAPRALSLALPVVEMIRAAEHVMRAVRPDAHLVAVRVLGDPDVALRREDCDPGELVAVVAHVVGAVGP